MYLQNKTQIGKVEEIFGCISDGVSTPKFPSNATAPAIVALVALFLPFRITVLLNGSALVRAAFHNQDAGGCGGDFILVWGQVLHRPHEAAANGPLPAPTKGRWRQPRWRQRRCSLLPPHIPHINCMTCQISAFGQHSWLQFPVCDE